VIRYDALRASTEVDEKWPLLQTQPDNFLGTGQYLILLI